MNAAHHVYFGNWFIETISHFLFHLLNAHFICEIRIFFSAKRTKLAQVGTDVGIIYMLIINEIGIIAIQPVSDDICEIAKCKNIIAAVELPTFLVIEPFFCFNLFENKP